MHPLFVALAVGFAPSATAQDDELLEYIGKHDIAVDISGRKLVGSNGDIFKFDSGTVVPANMNFYVASDPEALRAAARLLEQRALGGLAPQRRVRLSRLLELRARRRELRVQRL